MNPGGSAALILRCGRAAKSPEGLSSVSGGKEQSSHFQVKITGRSPGDRRSSFRDFRKTANGNNECGNSRRQNIRT